MKQLFYTGLMCILMSMGGCTSQNYISESGYQQAMNSQQFTFMARRANPTNYDVINVMNSIPYSNSGRMLQLDYGYSVVLKKDEVEVTLPYFGRMYNPSYDQSKNSFRFTSKDFSVNRKDGRKGSQIFTIIPRDQQHIRAIYLEVFKNGSAYTAIDATDRQPITYDGYITGTSAK